MNLISAKNIAHSESGRELFRGVTLGVEDSSRIALVGRNGSGKTTLLRILAGLKTPEEGEVVHNRSLRYAFLEQSPVFSEDQRIADFILSGSSREIKLIREYETIIAGFNEAASDSSRMAAVMEEMDRLDCWSLENRIHSILTELGIPDLESRMSELSGGMIKKAGVARTLVSDSNLLILDEPTNHLDIDTINWLEKFIVNSGKALLLVTHDRYFMDAVCSTVIEIEDESVYSYEADYSGYLEQKSQREEIRQKEADRAENYLRNEIEWIRRGPRARAGKDKRRKEKFFDVLSGRPERRAESDSFAVAGRRLGGKILELEHVGKSFGSIKPLEDFTFSFRKGDKIGIAGPNGCGKSTLLNIIAGRLKPDTGSVDTGVNTRIGYYDQLSKHLPEDKTASEYIRETAEVIILKDGRKVSPGQFLERFLFPKNLLYTGIADLSGGERKKLYLLKILLENPNFLIFDEPTNDFDIQTLSILEDFLADFAGCAVVVSHDRFFLDRTVDFLFVLDGSGGIRGFSGSASEYYASDRKTESTEEKKSGSGGKAVNRTSKRLSFNEKKELETIEQDIMQLEEEKEALDIFFMSPEAAGADLGEKKERYDALTLEIDNKYSRWDYLESVKG